MLYYKTDEVARNGVLQRITSARGFLGHPLLNRRVNDFARTNLPHSPLRIKLLGQRHGLLDVNSRLPQKPRHCILF
jgi:hypothetical protein